MKTTEELAKAANIPMWRLKTQLKAVNDHRVQIRLNGIGGRTIQKRDNFYITGEIPKWLWLHPELKEKYFASEDEHEMNKNMMEFYKNYPEWHLGGKL